MKKRLGSSFIGIPLWIITGTAIFILFSAIYDFVVYDRSMARYTLLIGSVLIILMSILMKFVSLKFIGSQARRQMGG